MTTVAADKNRPPARPNPFQSLVLLSLSRMDARRKSAREDQSGEAGQAFNDPGALERRRADIEHAANSAFKVIEFLIETGATTGHFCFMRRERDDAGSRTGQRGPTSPVTTKKADGKDGENKDPFTSVMLAKVTGAKLRSWISAGRTKRTSKTKMWAREAELHFRLADDVRDIILVDDVTPDWLPRLRLLGLWHVAMETSPANFQVLLKLREPVGNDGRQAAQAAVAAVMGGDLKSVTFDKWHRLPGSYNNKLHAGGRGGIDWMTRLPITDVSDGPPVADSAPVPNAWLANIALFPSASELPATVAPVASSVPAVYAPTVPIRSIKLPAQVLRIANDSAREFAIASELMKAGASLGDVTDHVVALAERRGKYIKVKGGAHKYAQRTLAGVMADFEFHLGAAGPQLYGRHEAESCRLGCYPGDFKRARGAAAERAGRRRKST